MGKLIAKNASFGIETAAGACQSISTQFNSVSLKWTAEAPEVTGFGAVNRERLPNGLQDYEISMKGFFATAATETDTVLSAIGPGGSTRFAFGPGGSTAGCTMYSGCVVLTDYSMDYSVDGAGTISVTLSPRSGSLTRGLFA